MSDEQDRPTSVPGASREAELEQRIHELESQTIYAVVEYVPQEGGHLFGVYSTQERAAQEAKRVESLQGRYWQAIVHRLSLDAEGRLYYWGEDDDG